MSLSVTASSTITPTPASGTPVDASVTRPLIANLTTTWNEPVMELPEASSAAQVTVVVPHAKLLPEAWSQVTAGAAPELSRAVRTKLSAAVDEPGGAVTVMSAGTVRTGDSWSRTIARNDAVVVPFALVAVQPIVVIPMPRLAGEAGAQELGLGALVNRNV